MNNMLTSYDQAMSALSTALSSKQVDIVLKSRADLDHIKLRARQLRDRQLLTDATEFQMRVERWLGVLLQKAREAGQLRAPGGRGKAANVPDTTERAATLAEIGVDKKLSMTAKHAAALTDQAFDAAVSDMRTRMASGGARRVSVIADVEKRSRRASAHDTSCFGFLLTDGTPLGQVKLGTLRSRIEHLAVELKILKMISYRTGSAADALASVKDSISDAALGEIIRLAQETPALS